MDLSNHVKFTKQQTFDMIIEGLAKQGWKRATTSTTCRYLTPDGLRCAAGQLVAPDRYDSNLDSDMGTIPSRYDGHDADRYAGLIVKTGLAEHDLEFVREAQTIHDQAKHGGPKDQAETMRQGYVKLAREYGLVLPAALEEAAAAA